VTLNPAVWSARRALSRPAPGPFTNTAIERILPHRFPFLLVDRITELELDKRIVGIKNVTLNERYLSRPVNGPAVLPPTILTEAVAQVGAILILSKPENQQKLIFFMGIDRVRYRGVVQPGDVVEIEAEIHERPPETLRGVARELITGVYKLKERLLLILDTERTVSLPTAAAKGT